MVSPWRLFPCDHGLHDILPCPSAFSACGSGDVSADALHRHFVETDHTYAVHKNAIIVCVLVVVVNASIQTPFEPLNADLTITVHHVRGMC